MTRQRVGNPNDDTTNMAPARTPDAQARPHGQDSEENNAYLVILAGSNMGQMHKIDKERGRTVMGRGDGVDLRLVDEGISREHAQLVRNGDIVVLEDLGSTNGTFVNGTRIERQPLSDGDKILLGSTTILKFSYHDKLDEAFQRRMAESALRDGLTKAFNKRYFSEHLESEYQYAVRHDSPLSLLFLDIDHFKRINDLHGHQAGDYVLAEMALLVMRGLRNEDIFARYGGEEFAVISRGIDLPEGAALAERLRRAVETHEFAYDGQRISVTISVGVARAPRPGVRSPSELVTVADETMYEAKRAGRNRVCVAAAEQR
jgi:two-component system cell cycle response regulator